MQSNIKKVIKYFRDSIKKSSMGVLALLLLCISVVMLSSACSLVKVEKDYNVDISSSDQYEELDESLADIEQATDKLSDLIDITSPSHIPEPTKDPVEAPATTLETENEDNQEPISNGEAAQEPTAAPTKEPTKAPTIEPTKKPTKKPTKAPTPTPSPTKVPSLAPPIVDSKYSKEASDILEKIISKGMSDVEKIKAVHDYIVVNTKYDIEGFNQGNLPRSAYTEEGVLINGKAVCQGYAETFGLFMDLLDIESKMVIGTELNNGLGHAWNMVRIDDKWYHIDVTWDDPVPDQGDKIQYKYFLIRDEDISKDHKWVKNDYPKCTSSDYLYYIYKDFIVDSIDDVEEKFMEQYDNGLREITLLYPEPGMPDFSFMHNYDYLWKKDDGGGMKIDYSYYPVWPLGDYYVLTVLME